jgi:glycosyltransferase involved in cell wall biosynthesis
MSKKEVLVVLPAYNEEKNIGILIRELKKEKFNDILVVDDSSQDRTAQIAEKAGAKVFSHVINRGAGAATMTGILYARENNYERIILMDSDGQHSVKDAKKLLKESKQTNLDIILGSRLINLEEMPLQRKFLNFLGVFVTFFFFGILVRDSQSGFKLLNRRAIEEINLTFDRYEFCTEMLAQIKELNLTYKEVAVHVIYTEHSLSKGQSFMNGIKMGLRFIFKK